MAELPFVDTHFHLHDMKHPKLRYAWLEPDAVHGFLPDLTSRLAACAVAVVQGGLTTCMELAALRKPFLYLPLRHHFEQRFHVRHRLERYAAGTCVEYDEVRDPEVLAATILAELGRDTTAYRPVETDGAQRVARLLAELV